MPFHVTAEWFVTGSTSYSVSSCLLYLMHHGIGVVCRVVDATGPGVLFTRSTDVAHVHLFEYYTRRERRVTFHGDRSEVHWPSWPTLATSSVTRCFSTLSCSPRTWCWHTESTVNFWHAVMPLARVVCWSVLRVCVATHPSSESIATWAISFHARHSPAESGAVMSTTFVCGFHVTAMLTEYGPQPTLITMTSVSCQN